MNRAADAIAVLLAVCLAVAIVLAGRWYVYVAYASDPFDRIGVGLNLLMPEPVRQLGCAKLKSRFGHLSLPPAGCGVNGSW